MLARIALARLGLFEKGHERDRRPTQDGLDRLIAAFEANPRQQIPLGRIVRFAVATAMRQEEIRRIECADFDPENKMLLIRDRKDPRRKNGNDQRVPLVDVCSLALMVQEGFGRDPHAGDLWAFRGRGGGLVKPIWHDGDGACLFVMRRERRRFSWPSAAGGVVTISAAQISYLLSGVDRRMPQEAWRPKAAGLAKSPIAAEIVRRIDEPFAIERAINGQLPEVRRGPAGAVEAARRRARSLYARAARSAVAEERPRQGDPNMLTRWPSFTRFLDDGRICLSNNAAERALRCAAWRSGAGIGPSPARTKGASAPQPSVR